MTEIFNLIPGEKIVVNILKHFTSGYYEEEALKRKRTEYDRRMTEFSKFIENADEDNKSQIKDNIQFALKAIEKSILIQGDEHLKRLETNIPQPLDPLLENTIFVRRLLKDQLKKLNRK